MPTNGRCPKTGISRPDRCRLQAIQLSAEAEFDEDTLDGLTQEGLAQEIYDQTWRSPGARKTIRPGDHASSGTAFMLQTVDNLWKDHLLSMDHLKEGIGLRGYAQQNPLLVYKKEGFELFEGLIERIKEETLGS
jgi:preprotein translocase subunit SecA